MPKLFIADYSELRRYADRLTELASDIKDDSIKLNQNLKDYNQYHKDAKYDDIEKNVTEVCKKMAGVNVLWTSYAEHLRLLAAKVEEYINVPMN